MPNSFRTRLQQVTWELFEFNTLHIVDQNIFVRAVTNSEINLSPTAWATRAIVKIKMIENLEKMKCIFVSLHEIQNSGNMSMEFES